MKRALPASLLLCLLACSTARPAADASEAIDAILARHPEKTIAVAYYDVATGDSLLRNERVEIHAASTMKVPVMLGIFESVTRGELRLDQPVTVRNRFTSILDGSEYRLDSGSDSDPELYEHEGATLPLEELVRRMIVRSSNLATNLVIELIGAPRIMTLMRQIGADDVKVLRGVEDQKAFDAGISNMTTAYDLMLIFSTLAQSRAVSPEASRQMIEILLAQEHRDGIPAGLPSGTPVAHKTGSITRIAHDAGVVSRPDGSRYVLVVLTRGFEKGSEARRVIAEVSRAIWSAHRQGA